MHRRAKVPVGRDDIEEAIVIEVVHDQAADFPDDGVESHTWRHVGKAANVFGGGEVRRREQVLFGNACLLYTSPSPRD